MLIIVTGEIGIGKTTVCRKLVEIIRNQGHACAGILTYKSADKDIIIEDIQSGQIETLASINNVHDGPRTPRYYFNRRGIKFGIDAIDKGAFASILVVDEIGRLELRGEGFIKIIDLLNIGKVKDCILVIRSELLSVFLPQLSTKLLIFETTANNRNELPQEIGSVLFKLKH